MSDRDRSVIFSLNGGNDEPDRLGVYDDFAATEDQSADSKPGLVSLGFIKAAARRSAAFLFVMAVIGPIAALGVYFRAPHPYQALASILIIHGPGEDVQSAAANNQAMAETRSVAGIAVQELGLQQSASSFLSTYIAASVTDRMLNVTASGPSPDQAVLRASAVAKAFLTFRASELQDEQNLVVQSLNQQINLAKQRVNSIGAQITQLSSQPTSPTLQSQISRLRTEQTDATYTLTNLQQAVIGNQTTTQTILTAALKGSQVLTVAALPHAHLKPLITYAVFGLIAGLAVGLAVIIIRATVSDRLRRRDDIAYVLNAPVKLSVRTLGARHRLPAWPGRAAKRDLDMRRVIAHLRGAIPRSTDGPVGVAIVAIDNAPVVAQAVVALAGSYASQGSRVAAADLSKDADMAHLLRVKGPGAHAVSHDGVNFTMVVPDRADIALVGPRRAVTPAGPAQAGDALVVSYAPADVLLTLVTLDPALGGDHLATWAANAVVVVTAGRSPAERVHGVGEMIRLAGTRLVSVVLIGADKGDESLGLTPRPDEQAGIGVLGRGLIC
jgi:capsular polysaccharide biosynthesis protein